MTAIILIGVLILLAMVGIAAALGISVAFGVRRLTPEEAEREAGKPWISLKFGKEAEEEARKRGGCPPSDTNT